MIKSAESRERDWWVRLFCFVLVMNKYKLSYCTSPLDKICKSYFDIRAGGYRVLNAETFMSVLQLKYSGLPWWLSGKNLPAMQETRVRSLDWEDPLEKEMATHSSVLAWRIPWTEEPGGLQSTELQRVGHG